ncbi:MULTISPECIES: AraC family transcriptional regulator [unclassified Granulicatella]|uniref:AraC family transcriptional regulator n=1 Tax=unclassified Granulicatella TaxID=2630493 RepID=UPI0025543E5D|nr:MULTISPECIES: AraC family transcriptional regulator [unclassified Granulicatella]MDK8380880.1 AraC family transcriptional regulator [Granulicatella sp. UMB5615B]MDK8522106.1 AraC family transcriptional regulator [Granulicatella sp. UMB5615A]
MSNERYLMMESDIKSLSFQLESITKSKYDSDWHSTLHTHPFTELFYVVDGKGEFNIQGQRFPVKPNDFVIINPQVEHTELSSPDEPLEYIVLGINGLSFSNLTPVSEGGHPFSFFNLRDEQKDILRYLNAMVQEATSQSMSYELVCHNLLEILLIKILRHQHFDLEVGKQSKATKDISFIKHYLETYYHESIQLEDLASMTHLSRFYISHSFKKEIGMSPMEYLIAIRIKESKILLRTTNYSISQVADIVGFTTPTYFSKQFRKSTGISPTDYREQFQGVQK